MPDIALGTTVFKRTEKLARLIESVPDHVDVVYVSDDGDTEERRHLYERDYPFRLEVIDLEYDAGLGRGRHEIVERLTEPYLYIVDSDNQMPTNAEILVDQLKANCDLGGISGLYDEGDALNCGSHDLFDEGSYLVRDLRTTKSPVDVAGQSLYTFDFVPNVALFRAECLRDYSWDPEYVIGMEHLDFYLGHKRQTDWTFATNPRVIFPHDRGGSPAYLTNRTDSEKLRASREYFLRKWDLDGIVNIPNRWLHTYDPDRERTRALKSVFSTVLRTLPPALSVELISLINDHTGYHL
ncbi:glycosyltransferase family 2 protein [Haloarcula laminariae]|uniref:glycosyltransferase family 2 protein n=1 Tax=Haloarcula laminariae TaxID=2961577 RepID=UPI0021C7F6F9|nr:glycosyltransferase [Halomicroarcula laminariae]